MRKTLSSLQNPLIKHIVKLQENRIFRYENREVVIEGVKMVKETPHLKAVLAAEESLIPTLAKGIETFLVTQKIMNKICRAKSPEGIIAIAKMPSFSSLETKNKILALDGVSDPGNLGTLIRTALAFGWQGIYLVGNCCDPFNEKALRAAKGATFKISLQQGEAKQFQEFIKKNPYQILIGELSGIHPEKVKSSKKRLLILGSEAKGVSTELKSLGQNVTLPIAKATESLNVAVAGGILMFLL